MMTTKLTLQHWIAAGLFGIAALFAVPAHAQAPKVGDKAPI
jgi:hypothetical protein